MPEMRERAVKLLLHGDPPTIEKRAAAYRAQCRWVERTIPSDLMILVESLGLQDGKVKQACRSYMYWDLAPQRHRLTVMAATIDARKTDLLDCAIAIVSDHALHRLFQRLNTIDHRTVLRELAPGIEILSCWGMELIAASISPVHIPTRSGALVVRYAASAQEGAAFVAVTWISDERMRESRIKLAAVQETRSERGVLGMVNEGFIVISGERLARCRDIANGEERALLRLFRPSASRSAEKRRYSALR